MSRISGHQSRRLRFIVLLAAQLIMIMAAVTIILVFK